MTATGQLNRIRLARIVNNLPAAPLTGKRSTEASQRDTLLAEMSPDQLKNLQQQRTHGATVRGRVALGNVIQASATLAIFQSKQAAKAKKGTAK